MSVEVRVPTLGESVTEATIATWFKQPGDAVAVDEMLCELETDKVTVEVPAPSSGTLGDIIAAEGDTVGVDALLATINEGAGAAPAPKADAKPRSSATKASLRSAETERAAGANRAAKPSRKPGLGARAEKPATRADKLPFQRSKALPGLPD